LVELVRIGVPLATAAASLGVGKRTIFTWLRRGRSDAPVDAIYCERVVRARMEHESQLVAMFTSAPSDDWRVFARRLETEYPERWGVRARR
jgi:hypothetical protein